ncbi:MarR family transcriptional regulator [Ramlibacter aquaticus]|uniref:MarR family transcriptional regulator n=2 Tax=Ramlibacter TaxID=174951 RepID=A0ABR9SI43_9BURK|nr:MarR family transcriptional regulator [Ramlibacter aquaticus]MBE7942041.1 MarR family transcriptional regulator [Ramlibacter aquaticus]
MSKAELEARARFRRELRQFERASEEAARAHEVTWAQYQLLLQVGGMPGRDWALVGELATALALRQHTTVELIDRCEAAGLVERTREEDDQRKVRISLTALGRRKLNAVAVAQGREIAHLLEVVRGAIGQAAGPGPGDSD